MPTETYAILVYDQESNKRYWIKDTVYPGTITFSSLAEAKNYIKKENILPIHNGSYEICIYKEGLA